MKVSPAGIAEIISHEAIVPFRYKDSVAVDTFGVGHTHNAGPPDPRQMRFADERPLSEVIEVFRRDLAKFEKRVTAAVKVPVREPEFDALVSFDFNTGGIQRANLTIELNAGDRARAAKSFMGWVKPPEIKPRREKEQKLFKTGVYSSGGFANVYPATVNGAILWKKGKRINIMPAIAGIVSANENDVRADADRNKGVATGTGGVASGGATQAPEATMPTDPATLKWVLAAIAAGLIIAAVIYFVRSSSRRKAATMQSNAAAKALEAELVNAPTVDGTP